MNHVRYEEKSAAHNNFPAHLNILSPRLSKICRDKRVHFVVKT